jgi:hypothetical protein
MGREARGWSFPNDGSKFWLNPPSGFRVMGVGFGRSDGGADLFHCGGQEAEERRGEERRGEERRGACARTRILAACAHKNFGQNTMSSWIHFSTSSYESKYGGRKTLPGTEFP